MSAFTKREAAENLFTIASATGNGRVLGAPDEDFMAQVIAGRLACVDRAIAAVDAAMNTDRILLREPDDLRLSQWRAVLESRRERLAATLPEQT